MQGRAGWDAVLPFIGYNKSIIVSVTMTLEDHSLSKYLDMVLLDQKIKTKEFLDGLRENMGQVLMA